MAVGRRVVCYPQACYPAFDAYSNMWNMAARWYQGRHQGAPVGVRGPGDPPLCQETPFWGLAVEPWQHRYPAGGAYPGLAGASVRPGYRPRAGEGWFVTPCSSRILQITVITLPPAPPHPSAIAIMGLLARCMACHVVGAGPAFCGTRTSKSRGCPIRNNTSKCMVR